MIPEALARHIESGVGAMIATRDADNVPEVVRIYGAAVDRERRTVKVLVPMVGAAKTFDNLRANGQIAAVFSLPTTYCSYQVKGRCIRIADTTDDDRAFQDRYHQLFLDQATAIGIPAFLIENYPRWPAAVVEFEVHEQFVQTPGPGAGRKEP